MNLPNISGANVVIKVTPETLVTKADEVLADVSLMKQNLDTLMQKIEGTKGYWIGEAGELNRKLFTDQKQEIETMMRRLNEHPNDLKTIAGKYTAIEKQVTVMANALTDDVII